ncbi:Calcium-activated chloride channel regulator 4 [Lamellibrachia satsuma]|nr:Calcium-activated chloride channel regulator 4 [Lamellibrachia satsuma]
MSWGWLSLYLDQTYLPGGLQVHIEGDWQSLHLRPMAARNSANVRGLFSYADFFTQASNDLFKATQKRVYFRSITILVPKSWANRDNYDAATSETFSSANVVIDGLEVDTPTTRMSGECGQPGEFIQIPVGYMRESLSNMVRNFGYPVGHLRWGLRDEYPVDGYPGFYRDPDREVAAVKCGKYMKGRHVDYVTGDVCTLDRTTGLPTRTCYFKPDIDAGVQASLMFYHNVTGVWTFCDNDKTDPDTLHNDEAPNIHNDLCNGRSAWEVMRDHEDFRNGNSPAIDRSQKVDPTFRIVQAKNQRIVMVMDVSGSMDKKNSAGVTRLQRLRQTVAEFLLKAVPTGYSVGLTIFSDDGLTVAPLTEITSQSVREQLVAKLPVSTIGGTEIGRGLLQGVDVLEANGASAGGGILILVSDGQESGGYPTMSDVTPGLVSKGVVVHTVLLTNEAANGMIQLAADTNGRSFYDSGLSVSTELLSAFRSSVTGDDSAAPGAAPVEVFLQPVTVDAGSVVIKYVPIDSSIGRDTEFVFSYVGTTFPLYVVVTSPRGQNYTGHSNDATKQMTISLNNTNEAGRWTVMLNNPTSTTVVTQLLVTSKAPSDDSYPIKTAVSLSHQQLNYNDETTFKLIVTTEVKRGYAPVIGAKVEVQAGSMPWRPMNDGGLGVDAVRGDGYYTTFLFNFPNDGKYPVRVRATAAQGTARIQTGGGSRAFRLPTAVNRKASGPTYEDVQSFERTAAAGLIKVSNRLSHPDLRELYPFPPGKVKDLKIIETSYEEKTVTLQWTAVGDFEELETASSYDIRYSSDIKVLRHSFENATQLGESDVMSGKLNSPANASEHETFVIRFPAVFEDKTLFFGLKVNHSASRISDVSNVVSAALVLIASDKSMSSTSLPVLPFIIGGVAGMLLLITVVGVCISCNRRRARRSNGTV